MESSFIAIFFTLIIYLDGVVVTTVTVVRMKGEEGTVSEPPSLQKDLCFWV